MVKLLWIGITALLAGCASPAGTLEQRLDNLFTAYNSPSRPGYAIGVVQSGKLIHGTGYGAANLQQARPISADTAFNVASLSKQFTAAAVAMEIVNGRLNLDDTLVEHWPELPEFMHNITIGHLVYMTSGLPEYYNLPSPKGGWSSEDKFTVDDAISAVFASGALEYEPGTRWTYSNINYQLLATLVSRLNNRSFANHMTLTFFEPLNMTQTWVDAPIDGSRTDRVTAYVWEDHQKWQAAPRMSPHFGGSGMFSSLTDLAKWDEALYVKQTFGDAFTSLMLSTRRYAHDKDNDAFGLVHSRYQGMPTIWYEGGDYGISAYMVRLPERDQTVICLANFAQGRCADKARAVIDMLMAFGPA